MAVRRRTNAPTAELAERQAAVKALYESETLYTYKQIGELLGIDANTVNNDIRGMRARQEIL